MSLELDFAYIKGGLEGEGGEVYGSLWGWSPQSQGYDPLLRHGICEGHRRPWLGSWGAVSSSVTCVASASVLPSAEGHLHRVIGRNGENVYGKKKR